jgi:hypothetical protein
MLPIARLHRVQNRSRDTFLLPTKVAIHLSWPRPAGQESIGLMRESPVEDAWLRRQTVTVQTYLFPIPI